MKQIDWPAVATQTRELFPDVVQIASYSRNRWILVFNEEAENFLNTFHPLTRIIHRHKLPIPLIVSVSFIQSSLDSYPLEFLDIQSDYTSLYAVEDIVSGLRFDGNDVRLEIERELRSKWLLTRLAALDYSQKPKRLYGILEESFTALLPVFKGFCHLAGKAVPGDTESLLNQLEEILRTELRAFRFIAGQKSAPSQALTANLFNDYLRALNLCIGMIDSWELS